MPLSMQTVVKRCLWLAGIVLLHGCATARSTVPAHDAYLTSSNCLSDALREENMQFPVGAGVATVKMGEHYDARTFTICMQAAGYAPAGVQPDGYFGVARRCLTESGDASDRDAAYGACVARHFGSVSVEAIRGDAAR